jgi:hypothetical protein
VQGGPQRAATATTMVRCRRCARPRQSAGRHESLAFNQCTRQDCVPDPRRSTASAPVLRSVSVFVRIYRIFLTRQSRTVALGAPNRMGNRGQRGEFREIFTYGTDRNSYLRLCSWAGLSRVVANRCSLTAEMPPAVHAGKAGQTKWPERFPRARRLVPCH